MAHASEGARKGRILDASDELQTSSRLREIDERGAVGAIGGRGLISLIKVDEKV